MGGQDAQACTLPAGGRCRCVPVPAKRMGAGVRSPGPFAIPPTRCLPGVTVESIQPAPLIEKTRSAVTDGTRPVARITDLPLGHVSGLRSRFRFLRQHSKRDGGRGCRGVFTATMQRRDARGRHRRGNLRSRATRRWVEACKSTVRQDVLKGGLLTRLLGRPQRARKPRDPRSRHGGGRHARRRAAFGPAARSATSPRTAAVRMTDVCSWTAGTSAGRSGGAGANSGGGGTELLPARHGQRAGSWRPIRRRGGLGEAESGPAR